MFKDYFQLGWHHIIDAGALDHILFVVALAAIYTWKEWKQVLVLVTAFTIGHSLTLALSVLNLIHFSSKWIEILIPLTIIATAVSNLFQRKFTPKTIRINYFLALFFGLVHGMGFANGLKSLLGKTGSIFQPLLGFNLGLEVGQMVVVVAILFVAALALQVVKVNRREWVIFLSGAAISVALQMVLART